jgi:hypothetical protein
MTRLRNLSQRITEFAGQLRMKVKSSMEGGFTNSSEEGPSRTPPTFCRHSMTKNETATVPSFCYNVPSQIQVQQRAQQQKPAARLRATCS